MRTIVPRVLKKNVAVGSVSARVDFCSEGLLIFVRTGVNEHERLLGFANGGPWHFRSLDGAASVLQGCGIMRFVVDTARWVPKMARKKRV
ncbi:partition protein C [Verminephrobacter aporrectodeae subsp. tuberculatae]|uniref:Partition protein C n=1 Tax=Verminephrobacter aporrectodeae subsp. tuberculatae TaxID=1110392 RepID=A0ABT3KZ80_9BURK|nr:partition protein C [Verminephrobacter aporrectodeae subsp. tuberculatae]